MVTVLVCPVDHWCRSFATFRRARNQCADGRFLVVGLADQQFNGANPRLYDFKGAPSAPVEANPNPDVGPSRTSPAYLADVLGYYAPKVRSVPLGQLESSHAGPIYVLRARPLGWTNPASQRGGGHSARRDRA